MLRMFSSYIILGKPHGIETGPGSHMVLMNWRRLRMICKDFVLLVFTWSASKQSPSVQAQSRGGIKRRNFPVGRSSVCCGHGDKARVSKGESV